MSDSTRDNIRQFIDRHGLHVKPWAQAAGISPGTLRSFLKGDTASLKHDTLTKLAQAANASVWEVIGEEAQPGMHDLIGVKPLEVRGNPAGQITINQNPKEKPVYFQRHWLEQNAVDGGKEIRFMWFRGDSMLPTIRDGDYGLIQIGLSKDELVSGQIYVLWDGRALAVKRLETIISDQPRLRVISDNKTLYPPYEIDATSAHIVGRVLWRGGSL